MKKFLAALATTALLFPNTTLAADGMSLTLDDAIELALKNNRLIEQSTEDREAAKWQLSAVRRSSGPTLSWASSLYHIGGRFYRRNYRTPKDSAKFQNALHYAGYDYSRVNMNLYPNYNYEATHSFATASTPLIWCLKIPVSKSSFRRRRLIIKSFSKKALSACRNRRFSCCRNICA